MRSKKLISITAFFAAFVFSAAFAGLFIDTSASSNTSFLRLQYDTVTADAVEEFLLQDIRNGSLRDIRLNDIDEASMPPFGKNSMNEYTDIIEIYSNASASLDDANLPRDVRRAWREHMSVWHEYTQFLKVAEDLNYSSEEIKIKDLQYGNEISRTWYNVLRISSGYGAYVPQ